MKRQIIQVFFLLIPISAICQTGPIVVVDGYFINLTQEEILKRLDEDNIGTTTFIGPDSAQLIVGKLGKNGLFVIETNLPKQETMPWLTQMLLDDSAPQVFINHEESSLDDLNALNPNSIDPIVVASPFTAVKRFGMERIGGIIKIHTNE